MFIGREGIDILVRAARVEITSASWTFSETAAAIERYFGMLERESGSGFELIETKERKPDKAVYLSTLGVFDFTPKIGKLVVRDADAKFVEIPFFNADDVTASELSAAVRFTERRIHYVGKANATRNRKINFAGQDIKTLIQAAGVEIASAQQPFFDHLTAIEAYFASVLALENSQFKLLSVFERTTERAVYETNLGVFEFTPQEARLLPYQGDTETPISFFKGEDVTLSLISAAVRFIERRSVHVQQFIRAEM